MKTSPTKEVPPAEETTEKVKQEEEEPAPEVNGHAEEVEKKEAVKSEQVKDKEESHSSASADTEVFFRSSINSLEFSSVHMLRDKVESRSLFLPCCTVASNYTSETTIKLVF